MGETIDKEICVAWTSQAAAHSWVVSSRILKYPGQAREPVSSVSRTDADMQNLPFMASPWHLAEWRKAFA